MRTSDLFFTVSAVEESTDNHCQTLEMLLGEVLASDSYAIAYINSMTDVINVCIRMNRPGGRSTTSGMPR